MKKILFFGVYIGDETTDLSDSESRLMYMEQQMCFIRDYIGMSKCKFDFVYIIPTAPVFCDEFIIDRSKKFGFNLINDFINRCNLYEYPAFMVMRDVSLSVSEDFLFFYCHSKGIFNKGSNSLGIFKSHISILLDNYIADFFHDQSKIKAGLFPSLHGWMWHNFFWVRSSYLKQKSVLKSENRHYYESFIGDFQDKLAYKDCVSVLRFKNAIPHFESKEFYTASELNSSQALADFYKGWG